MAKVIGIKSRKEINELPFSHDDGIKAVEAIIKAGLSNPTAISQIIRFLSNNSGVDAFAISQNLIAKQAKKVGK